MTFCFCLRESFFFFFFLRIQRCLFFLLHAHVGTCDILFLSLRIVFVVVEGFKEVSFCECVFFLLVFINTSETLKILYDSLVGKSDRVTDRLH